MQDCCNIFILCHVLVSSRLYYHQLYIPATVFVPNSQNSTLNFLSDTDDVREELVRLSVASGVLCRFTSFVAIDSDGQAIGKKSLASNNLYLGSHDLSPTLDRPDPLSRISTQQADGSPFSQVSHPITADEVVQLMKLNVETVLERDQCLSSLDYQDLDTGVKEETTPAKDAASPWWFDPMTAGQIAPPQPEGDLRDPNQEETTDVMMKLIESQSFNGSWTAQDISKILDVQIQDLEPIANEVRLSTYFSFDGY